MTPGPDNPGMSDGKYLPPFPATSPDPESCSTFAEWIRDLTAKGRGLTQRQLAEAAGATPQAVTKWLKGGAIEVERLARIAEWSGYPYSQLRRLLDDQKIAMMPGVMGVMDSPSSQRAEHELSVIWKKLDDAERQQLLGMAKAFLIRHNPHKPALKK